MNIETLNALMAIQQKVSVPKCEENKFGGFKYRSLEHIEAALKPLLKEHNAAIYFTDRVELIGSEVYLIATVHFCCGTDEITADAAAREIKDLGKKKMDESQATGSASSYARKYAVSGLFCIDDGNDADRMVGQAQSQNNQRNQNRQQNNARGRQENQRAPQNQAASPQNGFFNEDQLKSMRQAYSAHREVYDQLCSEFKTTPNNIRDQKKADLFYDELIKRTIAADQVPAGAGV